MKKVYLLVAAFAILTCLVVFAGCDLFHEHEPGEWVIDTDATCIAVGSRHRVCATCGENIQTESIPPKGHTKGAWIVDREATCSEDGSKRQVCSVCIGRIKTVVIPATGHTDGEWIVDKEATCTEDGSKHQVCSVCEETIKTETIPATGHKNGDWITDVEPTCDEDGSKHQVCSVCEETIKTSTIAAQGHDFSETITKATATTKASVKFECLECEHTEVKEYEPISVSVELTGSGLNVSTQVYFTRSFTVTASGGYGEYQYKFDGVSGVDDFSSDNTLSIQGNALIDYVNLTVTVKDEAGQQTVYEFKGDGSFVNSYVIYE